MRSKPSARRSVYLTNAPELLDQLVAADVSRTRGKLLDQLRRSDLLLIDELGYLPMDGSRANLLFQLVADPNTRGSSVVTSNVSFDAWGTLFGDDVIASAILHGLLHRYGNFAIKGPSYRPKDRVTGGLDRTLPS